MKIETSGEILTNACEVRTERCVAPILAPVTAVRAGEEKIRVCGACLEAKILDGDWEIPGARVAPRHALTVLDRLGRARLLVDVKRAPRGPEAAGWGCRIHRNLVRYVGVPAGAAYLLIGWPDRFFGWAPATARDPASPPDYGARCADLLAPFRAGSADGDEDGPETREQAVAAWMESVLAAAEVEDVGPVGWLDGAGLLESVRGGFVARASPAFM